MTIRAELKSTNVLGFICMAAVTLTEIFGSGATLNAGTVTFTTAGLAASGLTAGSTNPSEILAACVLNLKNVQGATASTDVTRGVVVGDTEFKSIVREDTQLERQLTLNFYTPLVIGAFDPDDVV